VNPFRYRGYYYDTEIDLYYLQSRYYDASVGKFINADDIIMLQTGTNSLLAENLYAYCINNPVMHNDPTGYGLLPVGGPDYFYSSYNTSVSKWANKYAPISNGVEYGAIIYRVKALWFTWFFMGETYKGFKTQNWYTVINGLGAGYLTSAVARAISTVISRSYTTFKLQIVGFAHTHPVNHSNSPSGPDVWMKRLGWIVSLRIFPIAVYKNKKISINYF